jgi:hypothetical protein
MADQGYDKQVYEDGIVAYRMRSTARPNVDAWYQDVAVEFARALEQGRPVRVMYDVRRLDLVTPYGVQRAEALEKLPVPDDWRVATLVGNAFIANMVSYVKSVSLLPSMRDKSRLFSDEAEALAWLREQ